MKLYQEFKEDKTGVFLTEKTWNNAETKIFPRDLTGNVDLFGSQHQIFWNILWSSLV